MKRNGRLRKWMIPKVGKIAKEVQERRLKWYGHVMRREEGELPRKEGD